MRKVTDALDERAKARLWGAADRWLGGYASSGSEHEADSVCLAGLIHGFIEDDDDGGCEREDGDGSDLTSEQDQSDSEATEELEELVRSNDEKDPVREAIHGLVSEAIDAVAGSRQAVQRAVMTRLREAGFNAGVCKVKWEKAGKVAAGSYEYMDVVLTEDDRRYVVELDFAGEFEIARPTLRYDRILATLPRVLVCRPDKLRRVVRIVAHAAKRSMKARGLHLPPWRKNGYMQAKWFGPYRRTTNSVPASSMGCGRFAPDQRRPVVGFNPGKCWPVSPFEREQLPSAATVRIGPF
ncbi:hypothetical protein EJ110_NYTH45906 [Nymphaea thermarum]|nr:hypothetical protein EJ110_NYTH45906 [Nymphaea thermarum]